MKSIRKSLNGNKDALRNQISTPLPSVSKPVAAVTPPQKVIRATADYRPQAPQELSFKKGDFFYVIRDVEDHGSWYEAHNPISGARGLVPKVMFEEFNKTSASSRNSQSVGPGITIPNMRSSEIPLTPKSPIKSQVFYAIVLHDFEAERADELDAKRGDAITVVAQSNREWFVAKPIGKLGRPGLIPVSFVEIHDPTTGRAVPDVNALMDKGDLPRVEDWKRAMFNYKQNSIPLGVVDAPAVPNSPFMQTNPAPLPPMSDPVMETPRKQSPPSASSTESPDCLPEGILLYAEAVSFHYEMEEYWFRVNAIFQPYPPPGQDTLPPSKQLILFRVYNDFYDFQVSLLNNFPREAGRQPPHPRMLPYMPGPAQNVNDTLTATRRSELDDYLHKLCDLNKAGAKYILEHRVVREFLSLKPGDVENESEPRMEEIEALFAPDDEDQDQDQYGGEEEFEGIRGTLGKLKVEDERSESEYGEDEGYAPSPQRQTYDRHPYARAEERRPDDNNLRLHAHAQNHQRNGSTSSFNRTSSPYASNSRSNSPIPERGPSPLKSHNASSPSISSVRSTNNNHSAPSPSGPGSASVTGRSRSQSNANNPPISAANPQTAFVKIKIFDRVADDLIAIRVHPLVSHSELMDKVQTRLGGEVTNLRFRDSVSNAFVALDNDSQLRAWMDGTDKHVLYAD
ncbi:hypothetical protein BT96DRAFT_877605 [Gymnopus androsaceus JB14]|uniref:Uncharacterized protein n=1 Tax=Gymnopus androsaceus JB14 TaxID=1447944 RepID=A0A6A4I119_9AGAR|nr:hypothetical protein BT96DRAFT_877605 [Gymnopus androsaceus JB14]